jgi:hypothetical protein
MDSLISRQNKKFIHNELEYVRQYIPKTSETFIEWFQKSLQGNDWLDELRIYTKPEDTLVWLLKRSLNHNSPVYSFDKRKQIAIYDGHDYHILNENDVQMMISHFQVRCTIVLEDWKKEMDSVMSDNPTWESNVCFYEKQYIMDTKKIYSLTLNRYRTMVSLIRKLHSAFLEFRYNEN